MKTKHLFRVGAILMAVGLWAWPTLAGTVVMDFDGMILSQNFKYLVGASSREHEVGIFEWTRTGGTHGGLPSGTFTSVCVEVDQFLASTTYDVIPVADGPIPGSVLTGGLSGMGAAKADMLAKLWAAYFNDVDTNDEGAAFQVAVWEIVYDDDMDLFAGGFRANYADLGSAPSFVQLAQTWLDAVPGLTDTASLKLLSNEKQQDQLVLVPLAPAVYAGLMLLGGLAAKRFHKTVKA
ncbi:MAG: hypothetical protein IT443_05800 [Phycisphaeraceae bacterium]|nr:hypothetical protein [Phycisphaeraceae bacterium]